MAFKPGSKFAVTLRCTPNVWLSGIDAPSTLTCSWSAADRNKLCVVMGPNARTLPYASRPYSTSLTETILAAVRCSPAELWSSKQVSSPLGTSRRTGEPSPWASEQTLDWQRLVVPLAQTVGRQERYSVG